jgi:hypothetical protein
MYAKFLALALLFSMSLPCSAQYLLLAQTQNAGITLNPAKVGIGEHKTRISTTVSNYSTYW